MFIPKTGAVTGSSLYVGNKQVARDASITLPEVTPQTADLQAMGTMTVPLWELLENLELAINKVGVDLGFREALTPGVNDIEARFTQTQIDASGNAKTFMCKAFCRGQSLVAPGIAVEVGSASENELTYSLSRYVLFVNGAEAIYIDRLAGKCRINGVEYAGGLAGL